MLDALKTCPQKCEGSREGGKEGEEFEALKYCACLWAVDWARNISGAYAGPG